MDPSEIPRLNLLPQLILEDEVQGKTVVVYRHRAMLSVLIKALAAHYDPAWIKGGDETWTKSRNRKPDLTTIRTRRIHSWRSVTRAKCT